MMKVLHQQFLQCNDDVGEPATLASKDKNLGMGENVVIPVAGDTVLTTAVADVDDENDVRVNYFVLKRMVRGYYAQIVGDIPTFQSSPK